MKITRVQLRKLLSEVTGGQSANFKSMGGGTGGSGGMLSSNSTAIPTKLNQVTGDVILNALIKLDPRFDFKKLARKIFGDENSAAIQQFVQHVTKLKTALKTKK